MTPALAHTYHLDSFFPLNYSFFIWFEPIYLSCMRFFAFFLSCEESKRGVYRQKKSLHRVDTLTTGLSMGRTKGERESSPTAAW